MDERAIKIEAALRKILEKFPTPEILDEIDDDKMSGRRPVGTGNFTIQEIREAWAVLGKLSKKAQ